MYGFCFTTNVTHDHALLWFKVSFHNQIAMGNHPLGLIIATFQVSCLLAYELCL